jgi:uncharacterized protein YciI
VSGQYFFMKLIPPRRAFAQDMTAEERAVMQQHVNYVGEAFSKGTVLIYGPVMATAGAFGKAVPEMPDAAAVQRFGDEDPSVKAGPSARHNLSDQGAPRTFLRVPRLCIIALRQ